MLVPVRVQLRQRYDTRVKIRTAPSPIEGVVRELEADRRALLQRGAREMALSAAAGRLQRELN